MAKKEKKQAFSIQGFDASHIKTTEAYVQAIDMLYNQAVLEFTQLASKVNINQDKPFSFSDYPQTNAKAQEIINGLASKMKAVINKGSRDQWLYACKKNDEFINHILNTSQIPKTLLSKLQNKNLEALDAFQNRKVSGLDLSKRVWNYAGQMKTQMELGIDIALGEGKSAQQLSRDLRQYLVDPDKLFHKVKNKHGQLVLSKNAAAFHPGQGKYRSSYKNAMRLTRSEINMAYREADQIRWQQLDFVVGFEVRLSNNHTTLINGVPTPFTDICDELAGKYPKSFRFKGWHPQCRCQVFPILMDREEFNTDELNELRAAIKGTEYKKFQSKNQVTDVPQGFKDWVEVNADKSKNWASQPYFIRDNFKGGVLSGGLKIDLKTAEQMIAEQEAAKQLAEQEAKMKAEAEAAAKAKVWFDKNYKMASNLVAKAEKAGYSGEELTALKAALETEGITAAQIKKLYLKANAAYKNNIEISKDPLSKEALLKKYTQDEVENLFSAYDNFYNVKINHLDIASKIHKLEFEVNWLEKNGKYKTSGELKKMLERDIVKLKLGIEKELVIKEASSILLSNKSIKDGNVQKIIKELQKIVDSKDPDINALKTAIGNAEKAIENYQLQNIRTVSQDDFTFFEDEKSKYSITKFYTADEKAKVKDLREKLNSEIIKAKGNLRAEGVYEAQKVLAEYIYKVQFKYVSKQASIKHIGMKLNKNDEFDFDYVTDAEAKEAFDRYIKSKQTGSGFYSNSVGGEYWTSEARAYSEKVKKAGVDLTAEVTLPTRYFKGSSFLNSYISKKDFSHVTSNKELQQSLHDYVPALSYSVNKLPRHNGVTYRGINYSKDIIDELLSCRASGKLFIHKLGMSTSITPRVADGFGTGVTFKIYGRSGIYAREFSAYSSELEVLYRAGSRFEVMDIYQETSNNGIAHNGSWTVVLKEVLE